MPASDHYNFVKTKPYVESLKNVFANTCLRSLRLIWIPGFKPDLHMALMIAEHVCDHAPRTLIKAVNISIATISSDHHHDMETN